VFLSPVCSVTPNGGSFCSSDRILRFHLGLLAATILACLVRPAFAQDAVRATGDYEIPGPVKAEDFLPKSAFAGKKLFVQKTAQNNGLQNVYRIRAGAEEYEITGSEAALQFLQELRAINQLRQISTAKAVTRGLSQSAKETYQTGRQIVRDPIEAVKKVPQGASRFFGKVQDFFSQDEENAGRKTSVGETIKGFLGVDEEKRKLAARLGVDVYSRNETLQKELDRVASAMAGGGLALNIGTMRSGRKRSHNGPMLLPASSVAIKILKALCRTKNEARLTKDKTPGEPD
jgi:hypothetical protein